jgi:hypothetical protein
MTKRRYDAKKLARSSSLKKKIAKHLAQEMYDQRPKTPIDIVELLAFGGRPFVSYADKDLVRLLDESYANKFKEIELIKEELKVINGRYAENLKDRMEWVNKKINEMQPIMDELIEEAFSE